jgi:hypothetical protein
MRTAHPLRIPLMDQKDDELLTVAQVLAELQVPRRTWQRWRELEIGPACLKLPNRELRVRRSALSEWLDGMQEAA